jgi:hypothetical protein
VSDFDEVVQLAGDLSALADGYHAEVRKVVARGALNIKKQMAREAEGVKHAPGLPRDISYDTRELRGSVVAEVGPTTGDVGSLALLYFGNSKTGPRMPDPMGALEQEVPNVVYHLSRIGDLP